MNNLKKEFKNQANKMLPDDDFKQNLKSQILPDKNIYVLENSNKQKQKTFSVKKMAFVASAVLVVFVVAMIVGFSIPNNNGGASNSNTNTIVLIDINPSFEIVANKNDIIESVTGLNSDARIVLLGKNYTGINLYDACVDIIMTASKLNYLDVNNLINIVACNENTQLEQNTIQNLQSQISEVVSSQSFVVSNAEQAKEQIISELVLMYGQIDGLDQKTIVELHRLLMNYDITKEDELDKLEDLWEEELEKAGFDDDIAEDILDKWKEENLKPLGGDLEDEIEDYIELYELKLIYQGKSEKEASRLAKQEQNRLNSMFDRKEVRSFIDKWWLEFESEFCTLYTEYLTKIGKTEQEINNAIDKVLNMISEDKKEFMVEFAEEYYEAIIEGEEPEFDDDDDEDDD